MNTSISPNPKKEIFPTGQTPLTSGTKQERRIFRTRGTPSVVLRDHAAKQAVACQDASLAYPPSSRGAPRPAPVALPPKSVGVDGGGADSVFRDW